MFPNMAMELEAEVTLSIIEQFLCVVDDESDGIAVNIDYEICTVLSILGVALLTELIKMI